MAGSHKSGVIAAKERLFENAFYLLTPTDGIPMEKVEQLKEWLAGTNAKFLHISPKEHDYITGVISHFPHIIAASLVHQAEQANNGKKILLIVLLQGDFVILRGLLPVAQICGVIFYFIIKM